MNAPRSNKEAEKATKIEITPEMVEAGFRVLCNSGIADEYLEADKGTVVEIFLAMISAAPNTDRK
jgi:hypothetical protein